MAGGQNPQNVNQAAASGLQAAGQTTAAGMNYMPQQLANTNMQPYQNPYQQNVIDNSIRDIGTAQQIAMNNLGAQATRAGAFGGSRHGVAEAQTNAGFIKQIADTTADLNMRGFDNAQNAARFDINNQMQGANMNLGAANQLGQLSNLGFGMGQTINNNMLRQGTMQQALQQQLLDAARGQYAGFTGSPTQSLQAPLAALGAIPSQSTTTQTQKPGLFDYLSLGFGLF